MVRPATYQPSCAVHGDRDATTTAVIDTGRGPRTFHVCAACADTPSPTTRRRGMPSPKPSPSQDRIIAFAAGRPVSTSQVAALLGIRLGSASNVLRALERRGLFRQVSAGRVRGGSLFAPRP